MQGRTSFTSVLLILPEHDLVISILSGGPGDQWPESVEGILRATLELGEPSAYNGEPFDAGRISGHIGTYVDPYNVGTIEITAGGPNGLQVAMPELADEGFDVDPDLIPVSTDLWFVDLGHLLLDLSFVRDPEGGTDAETTYVRNRAFVAAREPETAAAHSVPQPAPALPRPSLRVPSLGPAGPRSMDRSAAHLR